MSMYGQRLWYSADNAGYARHRSPLPNVGHTSPTPAEHF
jgi:hypothetical protein